MSLRQEIESKVAILDIVNRYVQTKKAWVNYKALCPFHQEKTPSFIISPQKNIAKCFSCGKWWGPISFLMEMEKIDFREAVSILAKEAGIELRTSFREQTQERWKDPYLVYKIATNWYHENLFAPESKPALDYLLSRGITLETIRAFKLGYSSSPRDLLYALTEQGVDRSFIVESGLFVSESRDKFFGRVIFPIANAMGHTVAFTGRILEKWEPKYLNSPASRIFDKSSILYWLHLAKQEISRSWEVYIVEWQMDTIALHQAGITNSVGISGTALTKEHVTILKRFTRIVYLMLDADDAGIRATFSSIENLINSDLEIRIILIPNGKDPDDFLRSGGDVSALKEASLSVIDYYLRMGWREYDLGTLIGKKQLIEKCLFLISQIVSPVEVDFYIKHLAWAFDISRDALYESYRRHRRTKIPTSSSSDSHVWNEVFSPPTLDLLAGYIAKFSLRPLFFEKFWYTQEELSQITGSRLLLHILNDDHLDDDEQENLQAIELYIDEMVSPHPDAVHRHMMDLLKFLHTKLLEHEKQVRLSGITPNNPEYLEVYTSLIRKAQTLGIHPGKITL